MTARSGGSAGTSFRPRRHIIPSVLGNQVDMAGQ
jgi:hypothetical protein